MHKEELRKLAESATPGPWTVSNEIIWARKKDDSGDIAIAEVCPDSPDYNCSNNEKFIAAANPKQVIELLDELKAKDERIAELKNTLKELLDKTLLLDNPRYTTPTIMKIQFILNKEKP